MSKAARRERREAERAAREALARKLERQRRRRKLGLIIAAVVVPLTGLAAAAVLLQDGDATPTQASRPRSLPEPGAPKLDPAKAYQATIETTEGRIVIDLDAVSAPTSVANFVYLARKHFYDGVKVNRAAKAFVMQTGSPNGTTSGGPGYSVIAELPQAPYEVGAVAWAKAGGEAPGTAGSQFFIGTGPAVTVLPSEYGIIGKVSSGLDVAVKISDLAPESGDGPPTKPVKLTRVKIRTTPLTATATTTTAPPASEIAPTAAPAA